MEIGLIIYFVALAVLGGVFLKLSMWSMKIKTNDKEAQEGFAYLAVIFFIAFVVCLVAIANTGHELAFPQASAFPPWLQEYWS